jgi:hypothetical protein
MMRVNNKPFVLQDSHIVFGDWDNVTKTFVPTADATRIDSVAVRPSESQVGLGLGKAFLGHTFSPSVCGAVGKGPGNANTGVVEGILVRGNNDFVSRGNCYVSNVCNNGGCPGFEESTRATTFGSARRCIRPARASRRRSPPCSRA